MAENNLEKFLAEIVMKADTETDLLYEEHPDPHPSLDTAVYVKNVRLFLRAPMDIPLEKRPPYPTVPTSNILDYALNIDAGRLIDLPEADKKESYGKARQAFIVECDKVHADDIVEITFAKDLRQRRLEDPEAVREGAPMVYCPVGSLIKKPAPEVTNVRIVDSKRIIF